MTRVLGTLAALVVAAAALYAARTSTGTFGQPRVLRVPALALDTTGGRVDLARPGRPLLIYFGYVRCRDTCPLMLHAADRALAPHASAARVLFIDADPWTETHALVRAYARRFERVWGANVTAAQLLALETALGASPTSTPRDVERHDARLFVMNERGVVLGDLAETPDSGAIAARLSALLQAPPPAP